MVESSFYDYVFPVCANNTRVYQEAGFYATERDVVKVAARFIGRFTVFVGEGLRALP